MSAADSLVERARLLAGRALAYEGLAQWEAALGDYNTALDLARQGGWVAVFNSLWSCVLPTVLYRFASPCGVLYNYSGCTWIEG